MRKISSLLLVATVAVTCLLSSCRDDDTNLSNQGNEQLADEQNATEETIIPTSTLETGIEIDGADKESGTPPTPNSNLDFQLNTDLTEAFQGSGLRIEFSSTESVAGAYIQFKDVDGNAASNYFDIPSSSFNYGRVIRKIDSSKKGFSNAREAQDFNDQIEVDFGSNVPAGRFCYDICLYDASNNVSQIQTVCVTVEAWGGNASIVGKWAFSSLETNDTFSYTEEIFCNNGSSFMYTYDDDLDLGDLTIELKEDGTYIEEGDSEYKDLDYQASITSCSPVETTESEQWRITGNWAFNEERETLSVIEFSYEDLVNPDYSYENEDGELYFDGFSAEIVSGQLKISFSDISEDETYTYEYYFNRL